jgi:hypothetical protein
VAKKYTLLYIDYTTTIQQQQDQLQQPFELLNNRKVEKLKIVRHWSAKESGRQKKPGKKLLFCQPEQRSCI